MGMLSTVQEMEEPKNLYARTMGVNKGVEIAGRSGGGLDGGGQRGKIRDNCNSIINKI